MGSTTRFDRLQKTHSSRSGSLTHPAYLGVCGKLPRQPLQSCASSTFYQIEMYKFYHELQKMHPSRGGSLTEHTTPVKTRARTKQATPTINNTGSCAVSTLDPACKEGQGKESIVDSLRYASQIGFNNLPRQPFQGCASSTIHPIKIVMSIIILQKTHPSEEEEGEEEGEEEEEEERGCASSMSYHITAYILSQFGMQRLKSTVKTLRERRKEQIFLSSTICKRSTILSRR